MLASILDSPLTGIFFSIGIPMVRNIVTKCELRGPTRLFNRNRTAEVVKLVQELGSKVVLVDQLQATLEADIIFICTGKIFACCCESLGDTTILSFQIS